MENEKVFTCRYAITDILSYKCSKRENIRKIIPNYDCVNCKDYSNKYYMTKEKTMQYREQSNGKS